MSSPFFSVIIPTFNRAQFLIHAITSVLEQSMQDFELIIINDGSTDETSTLLKKISNKLNSEKLIIIDQANHGVSHARNQGLKVAKAKYIAFLDSDDRWHKDKLQKQYEYLLQKPDTKLLHSDELWIRNGKRVNPKKIHAKAGGDQFLRSIDLCCISPSSVVIAKEVLDEFNGFNEAYPVCEDYDLWLKITYKYSVDYIETPLISKYGGHDDQLSAKFKAMDFWRLKSLVQFLDKDMEQQKRDYLEENIISRVNILRNGYSKYNRLKELAELNELISNYELEKILD